MKLLHIISQAPDFTGSGKFIQQIISQAAAQGHENYLVAGVAGNFSPDETLVSGDHCEFVRFDGTDLPFPIAGMSDAMPYRSTVFSSMTPTDLGLYRAAFKHKIQSALDRFRPDLIHSHHLWIVSALARRLAHGLPMVTTCHGTCLRQHRLCPHIGPGLLPDLAGIGAVMALNPSQQHDICDLLSMAPSQVPVVAGGYNRALFHADAKPFAGRAEIAYAGKLARAKGVPWLLKSLDRIRHLPFRLHLAGSGAGREKENCLALARALGDRVVVHGPLSHPDLADLLRQCHLFVLPSFYEGVPLVLMEALACGCRLVATDLPGVREILEPLPEKPGKAGPMVELIGLPPLETIDSPYADDEPKLTATLAKVLERAVQQMISAPEPDWPFIREKTDPYTWEKVFSRIQNVYVGLTA